MEPIHDHHYLQPSLLPFSPRTRYCLHTPQALPHTPACPAHTAPRPLPPPTHFPTAAYTPVPVPATAFTTLPALPCPCPSWEEEEDLCYVCMDLGMQTRACACPPHPTLLHHTTDSTPTPLACARRLPRHDFPAHHRAGSLLPNITLVYSCAYTRHCLLRTDLAFASLYLHFPALLLVRCWQHHTQFRRLPPPQPSVPSFHYLTHTPTPAPARTHYCRAVGLDSCWLCQPLLPTLPLRHCAPSSAACLRSIPT